MEPLVSIVVPAYNAGGFIRQNIDSLMRQTYGQVELVYVDDGSTDNTLGILQEYQKMAGNMKVIHQENQGAGSARNTGLAEAKGEYVIFLDADDFFERDLVEHAVHTAYENNADIVIYRAFAYAWDSGAAFDLLGDVHEEYIPPQKVFSVEDIPDRIFQVTDTYVWNKLYRRGFIEEEKLRFQALPYVNDLYFEMMALALAKRMVVCGRRLIYYRVNNTNSLTNNYTESPLNFYFAFRKVKKELSERGIYHSVKKSFVNAAFIDCLVELDRMKTADAYEYLYNSMKGFIFQELDIGTESLEDLEYEIHKDMLVEMMGKNALEFLLYKIKNEEYDSILWNALWGKKIAIYGAGGSGRELYGRILSMLWCSVVLWVDQNYKKFRKKGLPVEDTEAIKDADVDYIVITPYSNAAALEIEAGLLDMGIEKKKIIRLAKGIVNR